MERLAQQGTRYTNAWANAPWTAPSVVSVMTGESPLVHGVAYRDDTTPAQLPTLPQLLRDLGYEIGNFSFFSEISYFRNLGLGSTRPGLRHDRVAPAFANWLRRLPEDRPFFAWTHLLETHLPYGATGYRAKQAAISGSEGLKASQTQGTVALGGVQFEPGDQERLTQLYDQDVQAMDQALGILLDALEETGRAATTLVVFVADHGEELLDGPIEPPWVGHASTSQQARLIPDILRVPLILAGPGLEPGAVQEAIAQQSDILPTLQHLMGLDAGSKTILPGVRSGLFSLFGTKRRHAYFDSSPGGNLTPPQLRGHRLQGITDGHCLLVELIQPQENAVRGQATRSHESVSGSWQITGNAQQAQCETRQSSQLRRELENWRSSQAKARLSTLGSGSASGPSVADVDTWSEGLRWLEPSGSSLAWQQTGGQITFSWEGSEPGEDADLLPPRSENSSYWLQYEFLGGAGLLGDLLELTGQFEVDQNPITFGPIPIGFWQDVAGYSPLRLRVADAGQKKRTPWRTLEVIAPPTEP